MVSRIVVVGLAVSVALAVAVSVALALGPVVPPEEDQILPWSSGASGDGVAGGELADWRGSPVEIAGTWNDNWESHEDQWSLQPEFDYGGWDADLDNAVGAIYKDRGESWSAAARGAYDARWSRLLRNVDESWGDRPGQLYLRFAHEFNGSWYPWSVSADEAEDFKTAWRRFRALQLRLAPDALLVFCPSSETSAELGLDWRDAYPGAEHVDLIGVDYYNQAPFLRSHRQFTDFALERDDLGAPRGLESHRRFADRAGKPFAVPEWSSNSTMGDSPAFVNAFHDWLEANAGMGPGEVVYEVLFNVSDFEDGLFQVFPSTEQPASAKAYRQRW